MKQVRQNVFETNSSSTHSICIAKDVDIELPESIYFGFGEFGWECNTLDSISEKASYLYTGLYANDRIDDVKKIISLLEQKGVKVGFEEPVYKTSTWTTEPYEYLDNGGYVDHSYDLSDFLEAVCNDEQMLLNYLFSPLSFIITGNDNDDYDVSIDVTYPHDEFYKGN